MDNQLRRTMLYVPGNNPGMVRDAGIYGSDAIIEPPHFVQTVQKKPPSM